MPGKNSTNVTTNLRCLCVQNSSLASVLYSVSSLLPVCLLSGIHTFSFQGGGVGVGRGLSSVNTAFFFPSEKGSTSKGKNFAPFGSKFSPFEVYLDLLWERTCCIVFVSLPKRRFQQREMISSCGIKVFSLTLKMPRKLASENVFCSCRLLNILANFSNLFLHTGKQSGSGSDCS